MMAVMKPMHAASQMETKPAAGVMPTRPAMAPSLSTHISIRSYQLMQSRDTSSHLTPRITFSARTKTNFFSETKNEPLYDRIVIDRSSIKIWLPEFMAY